jgi:hypothetical protein
LNVTYPETRDLLVGSAPETAHPGCVPACHEGVGDIAGTTLAMNW